MEAIKLPEDYIEIKNYDFLHNKKLIKNINMVGYGISTILIVSMLFTKPIQSLYYNENFIAVIIKPIVLLGGMFLYSILHTVIHTVLFQIISKSQPKPGIEDNIVFVAIDGYMLKVDYMVACIAPWLIVSAFYVMLMFVVSEGWFWVIYLLFVGNLSISIIDLFSVWKVLIAPRGALIKDSGSKLTIFAKSKN